MANKEVKIKLSTAGASKTKRDLGGVERSMNSLAGSVKGFIGAFVGIAVIGKAISGLKNMVLGTIKARDEIAKFSKATGASVEFLSGIGFAAERSGASIDSVKVGMRGLIRSMQDVKDGLAEGVRKFEQLGIAAIDTEGNMRNTEEVFMDVADRISQMTNETEKAAIAQELFGRAGLQLVPLLEEGAAGIEKLTTKAKELGIVFDLEAAVAAEKAADAITNFNTAMTATGQNMSTKIIPSLTALIDNMNAFFFDFESDAQKTERLNETISQMEAQITRAGEGAESSRKSMGGFLGTIDDGVRALSRFTGIGQVSKEELDKWKETLSLSREELAKLQKQAKDGLGGLGDEDDITNAQIILDIQTKILANQETKLLQEQALLELKQQGLVAFTEEELLQQRIVEGGKQNFKIKKNIVGTGIQETKQQRELYKLALKIKEVHTQDLPIRQANFQATVRSVQAAKNFASQLSSGLVFFRGMDKFGKSLLRSVDSIAQQLAGKAISAFLMTLIPGGGGFMSNFKGLLGFQHGGPVEANQPVIVGERRPEVFIPDRPGTILPEVPKGDMIINLNGPFYGDVDQLAEEIATRSGQQYNRIAVNA